MPAQQHELHTWFMHAFNRGDLEELLTLDEPTATIVVGGEPVTGQDNLRAALERRLEGR